MFFRISYRELSFKFSLNKRKKDSGNLFSSNWTGFPSAYRIRSNKPSIFSSLSKDISSISFFRLGSSKGYFRDLGTGDAFIIRHMSVKLKPPLVIPPLNLFSRQMFLPGFAVKITLIQIVRPELS